jgi:hypothetical protein
MTDQHPITPPPELVQQWINEEDGLTAGHIATQAARWGADQELEACCEWIDTPAEFQTVEWSSKESDALRAARRPKPLSLKEQALEAVTAIKEMADDYKQFDRDIDTIRRALELLDD